MTQTTPTTRVLIRCQRRQLDGRITLERLAFDGLAQAAAWLATQATVAAAGAGTLLELELTALEGPTPAEAARARLAAASAAMQAQTQRLAARRWTEIRQGELIDGRPIFDLEAGVDFGHGRATIELRRYGTRAEAEAAAAHYRAHGIGTGLL